MAILPSLQALLFSPGDCKLRPHLWCDFRYTSAMTLFGIGARHFLFVLFCIPTTLRRSDNFHCHPRYLIKVKGAGKSRSKRPRRSNPASTYLTAAEYVALERAATRHKGLWPGCSGLSSWASCGQETAAQASAPTQRTSRGPEALLRGSRDQGDPTTAGTRWLAPGGVGAQGISLNSALILSK